MTTTTATITSNDPLNQQQSDTTTNDPLSPTHWTAPQELTLLQSLVHWKPVGLHKHFRMLAIHEAMLTSGTIPLPVTDHPHASNIEGIWRKLASLYDLKALDEREDTIINDSLDDEDTTNSNDGNGNAAYWREFELNGQGFEAEMWARRLAEDGEEEGWSDDGDDRERERERESTVADSEDLRSSPVDNAASGSRGGLRTSRRGNRRLAEVIKYDTGSGRGSSRRTSKAVSPSVDEGVEMLDVAEGEGNEDDSDEDEEGSEHEEETDDGVRRNAKASGRARGGRRGRGRRGRRAK